jgi:hypothetical protein
MVFYFVTCGLEKARIMEEHTTSFFWVKEIPGRKPAEADDNTLKLEVHVNHILEIQFQSHRKTLHFYYKGQPVDAVQGNNHCLF